MLLMRIKRVQDYAQWTVAFHLLPVVTAQSAESGPEEAHRHHYSVFQAFV